MPRVAAATERHLEVLAGQPARDGGPERLDEPVDGLVTCQHVTHHRRPAGNEAGAFAGPLQLGSRRHRANRGEWGIRTDEEADAEEYRQRVVVECPRRAESEQRFEIRRDHAGVARRPGKERVEPVAVGLDAELFAVPVPPGVDPVGIAIRQRDAMAERRRQVSGGREGPIVAPREDNRGYAAHEPLRKSESTSTSLRGA